MNRRAPRSLLLALVGLLLASANTQASASPSRFAPYVDVTDYPSPDFAAIRTGGGVRHVSLGFVTAANGTDCHPAWGGYPADPATGRQAFLLKAVTSFRRQGGEAIPSFGGAAGTELAHVCRAVPALAAAYRSVIRTYGVSRVDFDVEGAALTDRGANRRRAAAFALLQREARRAGHVLRVSYTLPVLPTGLDADGLAALRGAVSRGVDVSLVNIMAMDYGDDAAPSPAGRMGAYAISAGRGTLGQLHRVFPRLTRAAIARRLSVTPMLGINDVATETFALVDASQLVAWARQGHIGGLAMWSLNRDRACPSPTTTTRNDCSGVAGARWAFSRALGAFRG